MEIVPALWEHHDHFGPASRLSEACSNKSDQFGHLRMTKEGRQRFFSNFLHDIVFPILEVVVNIPLVGSVAMATRWTIAKKLCGVSHLNVPSLLRLHKSLKWNVPEGRQRHPWLQMICINVYGDELHTEYRCDGDNQPPEIQMDSINMGLVQRHESGWRKWGGKGEVLWAGDETWKEMKLTDGLRS